MHTTLPHRSAGIGLRAPHYREILRDLPALDFLEVHSENFFHAGGAAMATLEAVRGHYPLSLHGVGLSMGSAEGLRVPHLEKLAALVERFEPALVSEHMAWAAVDGLHLADLLPLPSTQEALACMVEHVDQLQTRLRRPILVENISAYLRFRDSELSDLEFLAELAARTGCGVLLDVNNLYVNAINHGFDALAELQRLPAACVGEIHLAGHSETPLGLIDTHGTPVCEDVWQLYRAAIAHCGPQPTLIERDTDLPPLGELLAEAAQARALMAAGELAHV
ncbi:DUF692 domain-containing protein [Uliginosibacterium sp. 31-12]|uniref:MNIO family bufferin maturase n=1 Tax=Uliginosibacterium sp. 31-12 TaxID=3062781 RepID=UPI0026E1E6B6|nr:DUF692 domain-containing protein [Uliginosibacterium sp. 31-12]MDO6386594.1 DUF692 domain-containing protein [Uliginosibacterium sp. 31-12]